MGDRVKNIICAYCKHNKKDNIKITDTNYKMEALEVPYLNVFFHKECRDKIKDIHLFLSEYVEMWYN